MLERALVQFSCAANETSSDDLFAECLRTAIEQKDMHVVDMFQAIDNHVYQKRYAPFLAHKLPENEHIFLDRVINSTY